jgi:hypothetical protein
VSNFKLELYYFAKQYSQLHSLINPKVNVLLFNQDDEALPAPSCKCNISTENNVPLEHEFLLKLHPETDSQKGHCKHISFQEKTGVHWGSFLSLSMFLVSSYKNIITH